MESRVHCARPFDRAGGYSFNTAVRKAPHSAFPIAGVVEALGFIHLLIDEIKVGALRVRKPVGFTAGAPQSFEGRP